MITSPLLSISRKLISNMNFTEYLLTFIFGMIIGFIIVAIELKGKIITIKELNKSGYDYKEYSTVVNGVSSNWFEIIKR